MNITHRTWAEVNLDNIAHNVNQIKKCISPSKKLMGVVKADAYGHGAFQTAEVLLKNGVDMLGVAFADEAVELRRLGIDAPILILGNTDESSIESILKYNITPAVYKLEFAKLLSQKAVECGKIAKIHIKVDTGMHRIGFLYGDSKPDNEKTLEDILQMSKLDNIEIEGIFSHLATADEPKQDYTHAQFEKFVELTERLRSLGVEIPIRHISNSAAISRYPQMHLDMVRAGIILYGLYPSNTVEYENVNLKPAMELKSRIINVMDLNENCGISYGRTYLTKGKTRIATVAAGYADGYFRLFSGKAFMVAGDKRVKQVGRICMDQCMIDVTNVNNINIGDEVVLFGGSGKEKVSADELAEQIGTINYEITCAVSRRVPRVYIEDGKQKEVVNYLNFVSNE